MWICGGSGFGLFRDKFYFVLESLVLLCNCPGSGSEVILGGSSRF